MSSHVLYGSLSYNIKHMWESIFLIEAVPSSNLYMSHIFQKF